MAIEKAYRIQGLNGRFDADVLMEVGKGINSSLYMEYHNTKTFEIIAVFGSEQVDFKGLDFEKAAALVGGSKATLEEVRCYPPENRVQFATIVRAPALAA